LEGPILKPFSSVRNWLNWFPPSFCHAFFCCFLFLCFNPRCYFPLLCFSCTFFSFSKQYEASSFLCMRFSSFDGLYKVSSLHFHSMRLRLEHHHCHRSSSYTSLKFFIFCYQPFSLSFSFSILLFHLLSSWS